MAGSCEGACMIWAVLATVKRFRQSLCPSLCLSVPLPQFLRPLPVALGRDLISKPLPAVGAKVVRVGVARIEIYDAAQVRNCLLRLAEAIVGQPAEEEAVGV